MLWGCIALRSLNKNNCDSATMTGGEDHCDVKIKDMSYFESMNLL